MKINGITGAIVDFGGRKGYNKNGMIFEKQEGPDNEKIFMERWLGVL